MRLSNRVAAVIREAREVSFESCVDDFVGTERHEVIVLVLVVVARSSLELVLTKHLAHVLDDEVTTAQQNKTSVTTMLTQEASMFNNFLRIEIFRRANAPTFRTSLERLDRSVRLLKQVSQM